MLRACLAVMATLSLAAMSPALTLQWVTKWNPSVPMGVDFRKIVDTGSGYVMAGNLTYQYVAIVKTDYSGNVLRTGLFQNAPGGSTYVNDVQVDATGRVYLLSQPSSSAAFRRADLTCLDATTLTVRWSKTFTPRPATPTPFFRSLTMAVRPGAGIERILLARSSGEIASADDLIEFDIFDAAGATVQSGTFDDGSACFAASSLAFPSDGGGYAISGEADDRGVVYRMNDSGTLIWKSINSNPNSRVSYIARNGAELVGAGTIYITDTYRVAGFRFASNGVVSTTYDATGGPGAFALAQESGDNFIIMSRLNGTTYNLHRYNRATGAMTLAATQSLANPTWTLVTSAGRAFVGGSPNHRVHQVQLSTGNLISDAQSANSSYNAAAPNGPNSVFVVGQNTFTKQGFVSQVSNNFISPTSYYPSAYANRNGIDAVTDPSGAFYTMTYHVDGAERDVVTVTKFSAAGVVQWIRQLNYQGEVDLNAVGLAWSPVDSTLVALSSSGGGIVVAKLNPANGLPSYTRKITLPGYSNFPSDIGIGSDGTMWIAGQANVMDGGIAETLVRLSPAGFFLSSHFSAPQVTNGESLSVHQMSANRWAVVKGAQYGSSGGARVSFFNNAGTWLSDYDFDLVTAPRSVKAALAPNGDLIVGVLRSGSSELRRFNVTTGASVMSASPGVRQHNYPFAVGASPNGNAYMCALKAGNVAQLDAFTGAGTVAWSRDLVSTVDAVSEIQTDANNWVYVLGSEYELAGGNPVNSYLVRYLADGTRSAQRRIAGYPRQLRMGAGNSVFAASQVQQQHRGTQLSVARYTSP